MHDGKNYLYVGSWLEKTGNIRNPVTPHSGGIHLLVHDLRSGAISYVDRYADDLSVGYFVLSPDRRFLYAVDEIKKKPQNGPVGGSVHAFSVDPESFELSYVNSVPSVGAHPNYLAIDTTGSILLVPNYGSEDTVIRSAHGPDGTYFLREEYDEGNVAVVQICEDGSLKGVVDLHRHEDPPSLQHKVFQLSAHPHSVNIDPSNRLAIVADRGCDVLAMYSLDSESGKLKRINTYHPPAGTGPRNSVFHPKLPYVFVASEVQPKVASYRYDVTTGTLEEVCMCSTVPEITDDEGKPWAVGVGPSDIKLHPNGAYLYVSNRGSGFDTISCYAIDGENGALSYVGCTGTLGSTPRNFSFDEPGDYLYVGNQSSGALVAFSVDPTTGGLQPTGAVAAVDRAVCVRAVRA